MEISVRWYCNSARGTNKRVAYKIYYYYSAVLFLPIPSIILAPLIIPLVPIRNFRPIPHQLSSIIVYHSRLTSILTTNPSKRSNLRVCTPTKEKHNRCRRLFMWVHWANPTSASQMFSEITPTQRPHRRNCIIQLDFRDNINRFSRYTCQHIFKSFPPNDRMRLYFATRRPARPIAIVRCTFILFRRRIADDPTFLCYTLHQSHADGSIAWIHKANVILNLTHRIRSIIDQQAKSFPENIERVFRCNWWGR